MASTLGPITSLHYTANGVFVNGVYTPAADGFNLADVGSADMLNYLPTGVKGLVYVGMTGGVTAAFTALVDACKGNPNLYGFYLADEPGASATTAANLMAEADYIHANLPGAKTFMVEQNLSSDTTPSFYYTPANTHIDLFGLDPYPLNVEVPNGVDYNMIPLAVSAAEKAGVPLADIVPVYQAFGGGGYSSWTLPTAAQEQQILATWASVVPTPAFDYAYSWGTQSGDTALSNDPVLQAVFAAHNGVGNFAVSDSLPNIVANLPGLNTDSAAASLTGISGTATLSGYVINAPSFALTGSGTALTVAENLSYLGALTVGAGATLSLSSGDTLTTKGALTINGALTGAGKLSQTAGSIAFGSGAPFNVANWSSKNAKITIAAFRTYAGVFSAGAGATLNLSGGNFVLSGASSFSGATVTGAHVLVNAGASSVSSLTVGGTAMFQNNGALTQSGGTVTVGDASGAVATLFNAAPGTYDIADSSGIARGTSTASRIVNNGLFEKTGGTATSAIAPNFVNGNGVSVSSGTLDFAGAVTGTGTDTISGGATLEFDATAAAGQTIAFSGANGVLDLSDPTGFSGSISGFAKTDTIDFAGSWSLLSVTPNSGGTMSTLTLRNGAATDIVHLVGDYAKTDFTLVAGAGNTTILGHA